jgi:hypothetical protein
MSQLGILAPYFPYHLRVNGAVVQSSEMWDTDNLLEIARDVIAMHCCTESTPIASLDVVDALGLKCGDFDADFIADFARQGGY